MESTVRQELTFENFSLNSILLIGASTHKYWKSFDVSWVTSKDSKHISLILFHFSVEHEDRVPKHTQEYFKVKLNAKTEFGDLLKDQLGQPCETLELIFRGKLRYLLTVKPSNWEFQEAEYKYIVDMRLQKLYARSPTEGHKDWTEISLNPMLQHFVRSEALEVRWWFN